MLRKIKLANPDMPIYKIYAKITNKTGGELVPPGSFQNVTDNDTGKRSSVLHIYPGMPVRLKENYIVPKGFVNGGSGTIYYIQWPKNSKPVTFRKNAEGFFVPGERPLNIFVNITMNMRPTPPVPGLPASWPSTIIPVAPDTANFERNGIHYKIEQYPMIEAFSVTTNGIQGATLDYLCVADPHPPGNVDPCGLYVSLSRVRTRNGVVLERKLTDSDFLFFVPPRAVHEEDQRLVNLHTATMHLLNIANIF